MNLYACDLWPTLDGLCILRAKHGPLMTFCSAAVHCMLGTQLSSSRARRCLLLAFSLNALELSAEAPRWPWCRVAVWCCYNHLQCLLTLVLHQRCKALLVVHVILSIRGAVQFSDSLVWDSQPENSSLNSLHGLDKNAGSLFCNSDASGSTKNSSLNYVNS